jgi:F420-0:gamma-glutamyl ligase
VISDSFGRPWRWGIVDVALGVAGFGPLDDQRGGPDTTGRVMRSTIVAVADELASTAELASGKTSGLPVVLVRGVTLPDGGRIRSATTLSCRWRATSFRERGSRRVSRPTTRSSLPPGPWPLAIRPGTSLHRPIDIEGLAS